MTYLELCQRFLRETGYGSSGPTAVTGQAGYHLQAVEWIAEAYTELQNRTNWRWLRKEFTLETTDGDYSYAYGDCTDVPTDSAITRFKSWQFQDRWNPPKCYLQSSGQGTEYPLTYIPWESFQYIYRLGTREEGAPSMISIDPADNIVLGPTPNDTYVITGEYNRSAQVLAADGDTPELPSDLHMLICYLAMEDFGLYDLSDESLQRARIKGRRLLRQLEVQQAPKMRKAGPLA